MCEHNVLQGFGNTITNNLEYVGIDFLSNRWNFRGIWKDGELMFSFIMECCHFTQLTKKYMPIKIEKFLQNKYGPTPQ